MNLLPHNSIFSSLCDLGICNKELIDIFHCGVRDREDINVMKCRRTGALFLNSTDHMDMSHYDEKLPTHSYGAKKREIITNNDDTRRRYKAYANVVRGRRWLDIGAGSGAMLDVLGPLTRQYACVEPQIGAATFLKEIGHHVYPCIEDVSLEEKWEVISLFHVFEHLLNPLDLLRRVRNLLSNDGTLIIEVPHARDVLITLMKNASFCKHTFWSEHLFLHTRQTLTALVEYAGFDITGIQGVQRYPVANHLYWLSNEKPGGHVHWHILRDSLMDRSYESLLARLDMTDTIVLEAKKR